VVIFLISNSFPVNSM